MTARLKNALGEWVDEISCCVPNTEFEALRPFVDEVLKAIEAEPEETVSPEATNPT